MPFYRMKRKAPPASGSRKRSRKARSAFVSSGNGAINLRSLAVRGGQYNISTTVRSKTMVANAPYINGSSFGALAFTLSDLPNYTELTNLYDEYRIKAVRIFWIPTTNVNGTVWNGASTIVYSLPALYSWIDNDDDTVPTSLAQGQEYESFKCHGQLSTTRQRTIIPDASKALYTGAAFTGYGNARNQWIDNNSPNVKHYGIKYGIVNQTANSGAMDVVATFYLEFRKSN